MKFTIEKTLSDTLVKMSRFCQDLFEEPRHEAHKDVIAQFVKSVLVAEIKYAENNPKTVKTEVDIPDDQLPRRGPDPDVLLTKVIKAIAEELTDDKGNPIDLADITAYISDNLTKDNPIKKVEVKIIDPTPAEIEESFGDVTKGEDPVQQSRTGNNHKKGKKRSLTENEREYITQQFIQYKQVGGNAEKICTEIANILGISVAGKTPWQVTGYWSALYDGRIPVPFNGTIINPKPGTSAPTTTKYVPHFVPNPKKA